MIDPDKPDPAPRTYGLKRKDPEPVDSPPPDLSPPPTVQELARMAGHHHNPAARAGTPRPDDPNDVYAVLQQNRRVEQVHHFDDIEIKKVKSRRKRDFWVMIVGGNLAIIASVLVSGISVITVIYGLAGLVVFSIGLSWIMWFVMDDY